MKLDTESNVILPGKRISQVAICKITYLFIRQHKLNLKLWPVIAIWHILEDL